MNRGILYSIVIALCFLVLGFPRAVHAQTDPLAIDDASLDNTSGEVVVVSVLDNDLPANNWDASTVAIVSPADMTFVSTYVEPDQGVWTVNGDGTISFAPCTAASIPDASCMEALKGDPYPIDYQVQDNSGVWSNPAIVTVAYSAGPLAIDVAYFVTTEEDGDVHFEWVTATETQTAGFNLYVQTETGLEQINGELIPSEAIDSVDLQFYAYLADVEGAAFYLGIVSLSGSETLSGPYQIGDEYGTRPDDDVQAAEPSVFLPFIVGRN